MAELLAANQITIAKVLDGEKGEKGIPSYLHIAYATSADGSEGFSISESANKTYIGQYTDFVSTDSTDYTKYAWTKIKGETGGDGYSPTVTTGTSSDGSTTVTVTNKDGSSTTELVDGTARKDAADAAKVATNFLGYDSINGLIIGNKTSGTWSGYRSQILPGSFNVLDASSTVLASFGPTTVIGEEAKANLHLTFNNLSMVDKDGTSFFEVGDNRNADGIATIKHTATVTVNSTGSATVIVESNISSIVSVYADSVQLSSSKYSFNNRTVTINGFTANSVKYIEITYTTRDSIIYLTVGSRKASGNIGNYSIAEGADVIAGGYASHAEGNATTASGFVSHAEGDSTTASGYASHAEGYATTASGFTSHAEGDSTTASGWNSHAEGYATTASGDYSHAGGTRTIADSANMTAIGKFNTKNSGKAFAIGNGIKDTARSDAFTVDWNGNTVIKGGLTLGAPLSIANGGTEAKTAAAARANLGLTGAETKTLLWTNARPTSEFGNQTIGPEQGVDLSGYDAVEIIFALASWYIILDSVKGEISKASCMNINGVVGEYIYYNVRSALIENSGITFGDAYTAAAANKAGVDNNRCIPYKIYGIKEV